MGAFYAQAAAVLLGIIVGLWLRRLVRGLVALVALAGIASLVLIVAGRGSVLEANRDLVPQTVAVATQIAFSIRQVSVGAPGAVVGLLFGVAIREVAKTCSSR